MPGRYTTALQNVLRDSEDRELLSLIQVDTGGMVGLDQVLATYPGFPENYTACHNIAAMLFPLLSTAAPGVVGRDGLGAAAAQAAVQTGGRVIKIDYGYHSFTIIADGDSIESLEGWAGQAPGAGGVTVYPLHTCIFDEPDRRRPTRAAAAHALAHLLDASKVARSGHADTVSRSGGDDDDPDGIDAFENGQGVRPLRVTVGVLDTIASVAGKTRGLVNTTKDWIFRIRAAAAPRLVCWQCLRMHGVSGSSVLGRWHQCTACAHVYCNGCGAALQRPTYLVRERTCDCGGVTRLVA
jgi:hypothetical protein